VLRFGAGVRPFAFSRDGSRVYVQFSFYNGFKVVDPASGRIVRAVPLPVRGPAVGEAPSRYPNQAAHHGIDVSGDGSSICDAATVSNYVALVARRSLRTLAILPVGAQPADALTSFGGGYCLVTSRGPGAGANTVSVISYRRRRIVRRIAAGDGAQELAAGTIPDSVLARAALG
jgi:hypothetical protein